MSKRKRVKRGAGRHLVSCAFVHAACICKHSTGAEMVSRYCQDAGDWKGAIEFLLMAKRTTDAFSLAKSHGQMDVFTKVQTEYSGSKSHRSKSYRLLVQYFFCSCT